MTMGQLATALLATGLTLAGTTASSGPVTAQQADLSGTWTFNEDESDDPREQMQEMRDGRAGGGFGGARPSGGGGGRPGGGRPGMGGGGRRPGGEPGGFGGGGDMERMREFMQMAMQTVQQMELVHDDSSVTITYLNQPALTLATNGKKWKQETDQGTEIEYKAEWKNEELRVERKIDGGGTIKERFLLSPEVDQLFVITKIEGSRMPQDLEFRRVYDRAGV
jgi:hypothetical protein